MVPASYPNIVRVICPCSLGVSKEHSLFFSYESPTNTTSSNKRFPPRKAKSKEFPHVRFSTPSFVVVRIQLLLLSRSFVAASGRYRRKKDILSLWTKKLYHFPINGSPALAGNKTPTVERSRASIRIAPYGRTIRFISLRGISQNTSFCSPNHAHQCIMEDCLFKNEFF